jgi:hypothetical protein
MARFPRVISYAWLPGLTKGTADVDRALGLLISSLAVGGGLCGVIRPELYRGSFNEEYTPWRARIAGALLVLLGLAGLVAVLSYKGGPIDFFPA